MTKRKKGKRANNDLQNITHKTKDRVTRTPLKQGVNAHAPLFYIYLENGGWINQNILQQTQCTTTWANVDGVKGWRSKTP
jgi:hypothetical protein